MQWVAASLAGVSKLTFIVTKSSLNIVEALEGLMERIELQETTSGDVIRTLMSLKADDLLRSRNAFEQI